MNHFFNKLLGETYGFNALTFDKELLVMSNVPASPNISSNTLSNVPVSPVVILLVESDDELPVVTKRHSKRKRLINTNIITPQNVPE